MKGDARNTVVLIGKDFFYKIKHKETKKNSQKQMPANMRLSKQRRYETDYQKQNMYPSRDLT